MTKKWTTRQDKKLLKLVEEYKSGGLKFCEAYKCMSKTMGRTPSAIMQRHNKLMNIHIATEYSDERLADRMRSDMEKAKWALGDNFDKDAYDAGRFWHEKQKIGRILRKADPSLILDMGYGSRADRKPKTFIEKIKGFFKGGNNE
jgi:hypothetical protein